MKLRRLARALVTCAWFTSASVTCASVAFAASATAAETPAVRGARAVLSAQLDAWNRGDLDGFMQGYWKSEAVRFGDGTEFRTGWQATLDRYRATYPDAATMGKLELELVEARELKPDVVYVFAKWRLTRADEPADQAPHGLTTLLLERRGGRWVITRDHTSY